MVKLCETTYIKVTFEQGPQRLTLARPSCFVNRTELVQELRDLMDPRKGVYHVVLGPHGCGKTTALKEAVALSQGVVYFSASSDGNFPMDLAAALSIDFACPSGTYSYLDYLATVTPFSRRKCPEGFMAQAAALTNILKTVVRTRKVRNPILILDNMNALLQSPYGDSAEVVLQIVQDFAKDLADERLMTIIFAGSEGSLLELLYKR